MMWSNREFHSPLVATQNGTATLEDSFVVSYKVKLLLLPCKSYCTPWYLLAEAESLYPYKNLHMDIYSRFIHDY